MYKPSLGFITNQYRNEYIETKLTKDAYNQNHIMTMYADENTTNILYFWQLYSILGEDRIYLFIKNFYERIFDDTSDMLFRNTFKNLGTIEYHIKGQQQFWMDLMGGGKHYAGGEPRLTRHHDFAKDIMNKKGAAKWLNHMGNTLNSSLVDLSDDVRVKRCIIDFVFFFMQKYAKQYNFVSKL